MQVTCDGTAGWADELVVLSGGLGMTGESWKCPVTMGTTPPVASGGRSAAT